MEAIVHTLALCLLLPPTFFFSTVAAYFIIKGRDTMEDFQSETDSDYTSYWRDWVSHWMCMASLISI